MPQQIRHSNSSAVAVLDISQLDPESLEHLPGSALIAALRRAIGNPGPSSALYSCHADRATEY